MAALPWSAKSAWLAPSVRSSRAKTATSVAPYRLLSDRLAAGHSAVTMTSAPKNHSPTRQNPDTPKPARYPSKPIAVRSRRPLGIPMNGLCWNKYLAKATRNQESKNGAKSLDALLLQYARASNESFSMSLALRAPDNMKKMQTARLPPSRSVPRPLTNGEGYAGASMYWGSAASKW